MTDREQELNRALEAMHFGFRAMVFKPDQALAELGLARVHHRLLYFIGRNPQCSVSQLLELLKVSKQYINRPLRILIERQLVSVAADPHDRRIKRLTLTPLGDDLENRLSSEQRARFESIFTQVGPDAEQNWHRVMALLAAELQK
jgi:DNA-binding MarR family transcriptional regulator